MYSARKGWELTTIDVDVRDRLGKDRRRTIERTITVPVDLPAEQLKSLVAIAERTPVTLAIQGGTPITTTFRTGTASNPATWSE
ncbi:MAG: putative redox protein [Chloroflexota bacterium]|jgi:putative redox protein|nr:putative redox protein [Chloroflexota bacterium]